ncbi:MAG: M48 family metalloprotease [Cyclobacteriaceae bacterium]
MKKLLPFLLLLLLAVPACDENNDFVIFSIEDDKALGLQVSEQIASDPEQFPILDPNQYQAAYSYLQNITDEILNSGQVTYKDEFAWKIHIIENDNTLNAFATPGGYIYVYTGLIKFLDNEDDLAGVMGHEIAHSDQRHSVKQLQKMYGIQMLLSIILGENPSQLETIVGQIAGSLTGLKFSRSYEEEADEFSVLYLAETPYQCNGAHSFFSKLLEAEMAGNTPLFLSTHPNPADRIEDINIKANELGCSTTPSAPASYQDFKNMLP